MPAVVERSTSELRAPKGRRPAPETCTEVILRPLPKVVFLYPTLVSAVVVAVLADRFPAHAETWALLFLTGLMLNLLVLSFDFPRTTSLTLLVGAVAVSLGGLLLNQRLEFLPRLAELAGRLSPSANAQFYAMFAVGLGAIFLGVLLLEVRLDYWELKSNELIHHHGMLGNVSRYPAAGIHLQKEITDVFEFALLRSGRLLIRPTGGPDILLENVRDVNRREREIQTLLEVVNVEVTRHRHVDSHQA